MVYVCDAIMGSGKTQAVINFMNTNTHEKFIYITPYLSEADRIQNGCPDLMFVKPNNFSEESSHSKVKHSYSLILENRNITSTHAAFRLYTEEMLEDLRVRNYTLIIDENLDTLSKVNISPGDIDMLCDAGYLSYDRNLSKYVLSEKEYSGSALSEVFSIIKTHNLIRISSDECENETYYWELSPEFIRSFKNVYILTYQFEAQSIHHMLKISKIPYKKIYIERRGAVFRFSDRFTYMPEYTGSLSGMIDICEYEKLNAIGDGQFDLSMNWYKRNDTTELNKNLRNYFRNIMSESGAEDRMYGTYTFADRLLRGKGYTNGFVVFNSRATNEYKDRTVLAYCVNLFMDVSIKKFYQQNGVVITDDMYALTTMVQWIWRSAIRDGKTISIYIPSARMRNLLKEWIRSVEKQYEEIRRVENETE